MAHHKPKGDRMEGKTMHGYIVGVEISTGPGSLSPEQITARLAESLAHVEGVVSSDVEYLGEIETTEEETEELKAFDSLTKN
jgi:hypothetical protein